MKGKAVNPRRGDVNMVVDIVHEGGEVEQVGIHDAVERRVNGVRVSKLRVKVLVAGSKEVRIDVVGDGGEDKEGGGGIASGLV